MITAVGNEDRCLCYDGEVRRCRVTWVAKDGIQVTIEMLEGPHKGELVNCLTTAFVVGDHVPAMQRIPPSW